MDNISRPAWAARVEARMRDLSAQDGLPRTWSWLAGQARFWSPNRLRNLAQGQGNPQESEAVNIAHVLRGEVADFFSSDEIVPDGSTGYRAGSKPVPVQRIA